METIYLTIIFFLLILAILFFIKYRKTIKLISENNYKEENSNLKKDIEIQNTQLKELRISYSNLKSNYENLTNQKQLEIDNLKEELLNKKETFALELLKAKNEFLDEKEKTYNEGIKKGKELSNYEIQIHPYQSITKNKKMFGSEDVVNIGYKYMMFINNVPCLNSHIEIFEKISKKEINEEKVNNYISKISELANLVPVGGNIKLVGDLAQFGKNILNLKK